MPFFASGKRVGEDAILLTRGPNELRQLLHPAAAQEGFVPRPPFLSYVDIGRIREDLPEDDGDELLQALEKAAIALGPGTSCMTSIDED